MLNQFANQFIYFLIAGPSTWVSKFPMAAGSRQSPVNIETDRVESDHEALSSKPLRWKYPATASRKLVNPGYCWRMDTDGEGTFLSGGPLMDDVYKLEQYHCHWGCSDSRGSEHTVNGQAFAGEVSSLQKTVASLFTRILPIIEKRKSNFKKSF
ncbi:hypothetical protein E2986_12075 [Frieseomelitta varia]|uniref:carbonic anhydrase n=1 Tax=Frieseomelitta varia TaxID=561572 RepID=A0A833WE79_9HYME|nr:hypothetical protein E2986_12075 [Frieseomelitta varia]